MAVWNKFQSTMFHKFGTSCPPPPTRCKFFSLTETPEDYTLMVDEEGFKGGGWAGEEA